MNNQVANTLIFALTLLVCVSCGGNSEPTQSTLVVRPARVEVAERSTRREFAFISKPLRSSELSFRVSGPVDRFEAYAGNHYKRGSSIAEIDSRDFRLRSENAEALYRRAKADFERIEALYQKNNISATNYERARADYVAAKTVSRTALNELNDTQMVAPFDGYVGAVYIERYQDVKASQPVVSLVDISQLRIEVYVTQEIALRADSLRTVSLSFDTKPNQVFNARVIECARTTTANNLSYLLTAMLPNPGGKLPSGLSGKLFFDLAGSKKQTATVPQSAVVHRPTQGDYVWVIDPANSHVTRRGVTLGALQEGGHIAIDSGLRAGEVVATTNLRFLSEGMTVELSEEPRVQSLKSSAR